MEFNIIADNNQIIPEYKIDLLNKNKKIIKKVENIENFTWKQLVDLDACTVCGRCTSVCPANQTGKSLDPREIILKVGQVMSESGDPSAPATISTPGPLKVNSSNVFERITSEEVWACTSCRACDEICPVNIEILDKILDMLSLIHI